MCRLLGYVATQERSIPQIVGGNFEQFLQLSEIHKDGWGIARVNGGGATVEKTAETARNSEGFAKEIDQVSKSGLLHFRWATPGLGINESNSHPFTYGEIAFIHNGALKPYDSLLEHIPEHLRKLRSGTTDSELFFLFTYSKIEEFGLVEGVREAIRDIKTNFTYSSLNAMILSPEYLVVVCENNPENRPEWATDEYYQLRYRKNSDGFVVASSGWDQSDWDVIPNHSILVFNRTDSSISTFSC